MSEVQNGMKQRLVGALVIISLAVIFLPMLFDKPHKLPDQQIIPVPPKPGYQTVEISRAKKPEFKVIESQPAKIPAKSTSAPASTESTHKKETVSKLNPAPVKSTSTAKKAQSPAETRLVETAKKSPTPKVSDLKIFKNIWMVQLGTFSNLENARKLRDRLRKDGMDGHAKEVKLNGKKAVRVYTGPFINKREALKAKRKVDKRYRLTSIVVFFE